MFNIKHFILLLILTKSMALGAQIDTSFYPAQYPDGLVGLIVDMEQASDISIAEKDKLAISEVEILLIINMLGDVINVKVFAEDYDSLFVDKISKASFKLKAFEPALYRGEPVDSYFNFILKYQASDQLIQLGSATELSDYKVLDNGSNISFGALGNVFSGKISNHFSYAGGADLNIALRKNKWLYSFGSTVLFGKQRIAYNIPNNVIMPSNNVLGFIGIGVSRSFDFDAFSLAPKIKCDYVFVNVGIDEQDKLYRHKGIAPSMELNFNIPIKEGSVVPYYYDYRYVAPQLNFFISTTYLIMDDQQSNGYVFSAGVRYVLSLRRISRG